MSTIYKINATNLQCMFLYAIYEEVQENRCEVKEQWVQNDLLSNKPWSLGEGEVMSSVACDLFQNDHVEQHWGGADNNTRDGQTTVFSLWGAYQISVRYI